MSAGIVAEPRLIAAHAPAARAATREELGSHASRPGITLAAAVLGFFVITLDAVVVNVALPSISLDFGAGIAGLQWVVDGYTLMFAALLLWSGALTDRIGARRAFGVGLALFVAASAGCGLAPTLPALIAARFAQGTAAAMMMPTSSALLSQAYPHPRERSRAVAVWAMGGAMASSSGPVLGGVLTLVSWRWIFFINVPAGVVAMLLVARIAPSPRRRSPFDWFGQASAVLAMGALTYGAIEVGASGFTTPRVAGAFVLAAASAVAFVTAERSVRHPMVPLELFRSRNVSVSVAVGFAFVIGYYGLPFVMSLYLQQVRGLSSLGAGLVFVPMMVVGVVLIPFSARLAERLTPRGVITAGLGVMAAGLAIVGCAPASTPVLALAALMVVVGLAGPFVIPPITAVLLNSVPDHQAGTASGVFNTSRQLGGALAIAVFGALLSGQEGLMHGLRFSLLMAAAIAIAAGAVSVLLRPASSSAEKGKPNVGPVRKQGTVERAALAR